MCKYVVCAAGVMVSVSARVFAHCAEAAGRAYVSHSRSLFSLTPDLSFLSLTISLFCMLVRMHFCNWIVCVCARARVRVFRMGPHARVLAACFKNFE